MTRFFTVRKHTLDADLVLLALRVICGYAFILHGTGKIKNPFHWMGPTATVPSILQALAALSEFGGGIALVIGLLTRLGSLGILCTMAVAVNMVAQGNPFVNNTGGMSFELPVMMFLIALTIFIFGPGRFSADRVIFGPRN